MKLGNVRELKKTKFVSLLSREYEEGGENKQWVYASRRGTKAVVIAGFDDNNKLVLIKQQRISLSKPRCKEAVYEIALPAGLVDEGETSVNAAYREMMEETGYEIINFENEFVESVELCSSPGLTDEVATIVFCRVKKTKSKPEKGIEVILADGINDPRIPKGNNIRWGTKAYLVLLLSNIEKL